MTGNRVETDSLGEVSVPADKLAFIREHVYKPEYSKEEVGVGRGA